MTAKTARESKATAQYTDVMDTRWPQIEAVAAALLERKTLTEDEVCEVI